MKLGNIIKKYREDHNLSMEAFSKIADISKGYISMLENGNKSRGGKVPVPSVDVYSKLAYAMNMDMNELIKKSNGKVMIGNDQSYNEAISDLQFFSEKNKPTGDTSGLTEDEKTIIELFRTLSPEERELLKSVAAGFAKSGEQD